MSSELALSREELVWIALESTPGTLVDPVAADQVLVVGSVECDQMPEQVEDEQNRDTRSAGPLIQGRTTPGPWSFTTYLKPSGSLGVAPEEDTLLKCAFGTETVNASTDVQYTLTDNLPSFSMWFRRGHHMYVARGCAVEKVVFEVSGKSSGRATWSGKFMEYAVFGEDTVGVGGIDGSATTLPVTNGASFYIPSAIDPYIKIDNEVLKVTARSGNNLTVVRAQKTTSAAAHTAGAAITAWTPAQTESGNPVHGKFGAITIDGNTTVFLDCTITLENGVVFLEDEKNGVLTAEKYITPGKRKVTISTSKYLRNVDARDLQDALDRTSFAVLVNLGNVAGKIMQFSAPYAQKMPPKVSGSGAVTSAQEWHCIAPAGSGNQELKLICK